MKLRSAKGEVIEAEVVAGMVFQGRTRHLVVDESPGSERFLCAFDCVLSKAQIEGMTLLGCDPAIALPADVQKFGEAFAQEAAK